MKTSGFLGLSFLFIAMSGCTAHVQFTASRPGTLVQEATLGKLGETPLEMDLRHGQYSFVFTTDPCLEARVYRDVRGSEVFVHAELAPNETVLQVSTTPPDARVRVTWEGQEIDLGTEPAPTQAIRINDDQLWNESATTQLHVEISSDGYKPQQDDIFITRCQNTEVHYSLKPVVAELSFSSDPPGADVYDRSLGYLGRTPFSTYLTSQQLERISARRDQKGRENAQLQITGTKAGCDDLEKVVWVELGGAVNEIELTLSCE